MTSLRGKVALVSGGAGGLGQAMALVLAREGVSVVIADISPETVAVGERIASECAAKVIGLTADVATADGARAAVALAVDRFGRIDILVNNAGAWRPTPLDSPWAQAVQDFDDLMQANLLSALILTRACAPALMVNGGDIVNVSSEDVLPSAGAPTNRADSDVTNAAKWGLNGFTDAWSRALEKHGVRVNALCIGPTETPMLAAMRSGHAGLALAPADVARLLIDLLHEGRDGRRDQNIGVWPLRPVELGPVKEPHRAIFY